MGSLVDFPSRRGLGLVKPSEAAARDADNSAPKTPRERFDDAIRRLADTGWTADANHIRGLMLRADRFGGTVRDGKTLGEVFAALAGIPAECPAPYRHACSAIRALAEIATPQPLQPEPRGAA